MANTNQIQVIGNEEELNLLFKELLDGCRDDLKEATLNVEMFLDEVLADKAGKERYGQFYNDALRIKGDARDRQLKLLGMFKDRVTTKEKIELTKTEMTDNIGALPSTQEMNKYIEEMQKAQETMYQNPVLSKEDDLSESFENQKKVKDSYKNFDEDDDLEDYEVDFDDDESYQ